MQTEETLQETENAVPAASQEASSSGVASPETVVAKAPQPNEQAASEDAQATGQTADVQPIQSDTPAQPADQAAQPADASEEPFELVPTSEFKQIVETLLFITDRPLKPSRIADVIDGVDARRVREMILEIKDDYIRRNSAVQVVELGGGFQMSTKPEYGRWVRRLYNEKMTAKLSNAALETLAIVAYKQPITRAEMEAIRGVDVAGPLERLLERSLVRVVGKKDTVGRPMVYGTTDEFLRMFGLNKISDLPDLQVFAAKQLREKQEDLPNPCRRSQSRLLFRWKNWKAKNVWKRWGPLPIRSLRATAIIKAISSGRKLKRRMPSPKRSKSPRLKRPRKQESRPPKTRNTSLPKFPHRKLRTRQRNRSTRRRRRRLRILPQLNPKYPRRKNK